MTHFLKKFNKLVLNNSFYIAFAVFTPVTTADIDRPDSVFFNLIWSPIWPS
jgi:hypothetical protein